LAPLTPAILQAARFEAADRGGGYYATEEAAAGQGVLLRLLDDYDGAEPAASSVACRAHARLAALLSGDAAAVQAAAAARTAQALAPRAAAQPLAMPALAASLAASALGPGAAAQVIVVGPAGHPGREELMDAAWGAPFAAGTRAVLPIDPADEEAAAFWEVHNGEALAAARAAAATDPRPCALLCQGMACRPAVFDGEALRKLLGSGGGGGGGGGGGKVFDMPPLR